MSCCLWGPPSPGQSGATSSPPSLDADTVLGADPASEAAAACTLEAQAGHRARGPTLFSGKWGGLALEAAGRRLQRPRLLPGPRHDPRGENPQQSCRLHTDSAGPLPSGVPPAPVCSACARRGKDQGLAWHPWWLVGVPPPAMAFRSGRAVPCLEGLPREPSRPPPASAVAKAEDELTGSDLLGDERPLTSKNPADTRGL